MNSSSRDVTLLYMPNLKDTLITVSLNEMGHLLKEHSCGPPSVNVYGRSLLARASVKKTISSE